MSSCHDEDLLFLDLEQRRNNNTLLDLFQIIYGSQDAVLFPSVLRAGRVYAIAHYSKHSFNSSRRQCPAVRSPEDKSLRRNFAQHPVGSARYAQGTCW